MNRESDRVRRVWPEEANRNIQEETAARIKVGQLEPFSDRWRLEELEREWDMERALFAMTSVNLLLGLTAAARRRRWLAWPVVVAAFQLQHALQGWCQPVSLLRRLGVRTRPEIDSERVALKALRGDFAGTGTGGSRLDAEQALAAASRGRQPRQA